MLETEFLTHLVFVITAVVLSIVASRLKVKYVVFLTNLILFVLYLQYDNWNPVVASLPWLLIFVFEVKR